MAFLSNISDAVKVLSQEQKVHDVLGRSTLHSLAKVHNRRPQPVHNRLALLGNADTAEVLGLGLGLRPLHLQDLVTLGTLGNGKFQTLGGVNLIHSVFHPLVGVEVGNERLEDLISIPAHGHGEGLLHGHSQILLGLKDGIELEGGELRADHIVNVGGNLTGGVGQGVKGLEHLFAEDLILDRHHGGNEDIIRRFCLHPNVELLDTEGESSNELLVGAADESQAGLAEATVFAKRLDDADLGG